MQMVEEGFSSAEIAPIVGYKTGRGVERRRKLMRERPKGRTVFVPDTYSRASLTDEAIALLAWSADAYEEWFNRFMRPLKVYPHHRAVLEELFAAGTRKLLVNFPPRHGKTRLLTVGFPAWLLCRDRNNLILQISETGKVAQMYMRELAAHLQMNKELVEWYTPFAPEKTSAPGSMWRPNSGQLLVVGRTDDRMGEASVTAAGAGQQVQGLGFDWIIGDDLVSPDNSETVKARDDMHHWFSTILERRLTPSGRGIVIGTRVAPDDLYGRLASLRHRREQERRIWRHVNFPAVRDSKELPGTPVPDFVSGFALWPEQWPLNEADALRLPGSGDETNTSLEDIYNGMSDEEFSKVYQQVPIAPGDRLVDPVWITGDENHPGCRDSQRGAGPMPKEPGWIRCVMLDPPQTNYGAILVADILPGREIRSAEQGFTQNFDARLMELIRRRMTLPQIQENLERIAAVYDPDYLIAEINAAQRWLFQDVWAQEYLRRYRITLRKHTTTSNKTDSKLGFETLGDDFRFGAIRIPDADPETRRMFSPLVTEVTEYPYHRTDDCAMALWFAKVNASHLIVRYQDPEGERANLHLVPKRLERGYRHIQSGRRVTA